MHAPVSASVFLLQPTGPLRQPAGQMVEWVAVMSQPAVCDSLPAAMAVQLSCDRLSVCHTPVVGAVGQSRV